MVPLKRVQHVPFPQPGRDRENDSIGASWTQSGAGYAVPVPSVAEEPLQRISKRIVELDVVVARHAKNLHFAFRRGRPRWPTPSGVGRRGRGPHLPSVGCVDLLGAGSTGTRPN